MKDYILENRKVIDVTGVISDDGKQTIQLTLDGEPFDTLQEGELKKTNRVRLYPLDILPLLKETNNIFKKIVVYSKGMPISDAAYSFLLDGAIVTVNRIFKKEGTKRENSDDTYQWDCYRSQLKEVTNLKSDEEELLDILANIKEENKKATELLRDSTANNKAKVIRSSLGLIFTQS